MSKLFRNLKPGTACALSMCCLLALAGVAAPAAAQDDVDELRAEVERLRAEIEELKDEHDQATTEGDEPAEIERIEELERRVEILAEELERDRLGEAVPEADRMEYGYGPAASKIYRTAQGLSIGGYGEMLYENFDSERDDGSDASATDELDFLRAIVYFGYKFDDNWLFNSEIEFEHASTGESGSASVEFAYLDYLHRPELNARAGLLLIPMGFVNELHEPTVFLGATRPRIENQIIPTTWRENGFGLFGEVGQISYRTYIVNGLEGADFSAGGLRGGRQKGSQALAEDLAWVGRVDWTPTTGLLIGGSAYIGDSGQDLVDPDGREVELGTSIYEGHVEWRWQGLELRAMGVQAELDDVAQANRALGLTGDDTLGEDLSGWYLQAGYDVLAATGSDQELIPYVRWSELDTHDAVPGGFLDDPARDQEILTLGVGWKPFTQGIIKADWQDFDNGAGTGTDRFNIALGYIF